MEEAAQRLSGISPVALAAPVQAAAPTVETVQPVQAQAAAVPPIPVEKAKEYRDRLSKYSFSILPNAGLQPSPKLGTTMKVRQFALMQVGAEDTTLMTEAQWEMLFEFLDGYVAANGAPALVEYINKALGVA